MSASDIKQYTPDDFFKLNKNMIVFKMIDEGSNSITIYYCADEDSYYAKGYFGYMRYDVESIIKLPVENTKELNQWIENASNTLKKVDRDNS